MYSSIRLEKKCDGIHIITVKFEMKMLFANKNFAKNSIYYFGDLRNLNLRPHLGDGLPCHFQVVFTTCIPSFEIQRLFLI